MVVLKSLLIGMALLFFSLLSPAQEQNTLANQAEELYKQGKYKESFQLFEKAAADNNNAKAKAYLGSMYETGTGVEKDYKKAFEIFKELAKTGNHFALKELSTLYYNGYGVKADRRKAFRYLQLAAQSGNIIALACIAYYYEHGFPPYAPQNLKKAEEYLKTSIAKSHYGARIALAHLYMRDDFPNPDYERALIYLKAIDKKNCYYWSAQSYIGMMYYKGKGVPPNKEKAIEIFKQVAGTDDVMGLNSCAYFLAEENIMLNTAKSSIIKALMLKPNTGNCIDTYGYILYQEGKYKKALKEFLLAEKYCPNPSCEIKKHIGDSYHAIGEDDKALKAWAKALNLPGGDSKIKSEVLANYIVTTINQRRNISLLPPERAANAD